MHQPPVRWYELFHRPVSDLVPPDCTSWYSAQGACRRTGGRDARRTKPHVAYDPGIQDGTGQVEAWRAEFSQGNRFGSEHCCSANARRQFDQAGGNLRDGEKASSGPAPVRSIRGARCGF